MISKPKVLVVSYNIPRPDNSSGELRFVSILEILSEFWDIDFCIASTPSSVFDYSDDVNYYIDYLTKFRINVLPVKKETFDNAITRVNYDGGYFNQYWVAEATLSAFKKARPNAFTIVDSVDVQYARKESQAKIGELSYSEVEDTKKKELSIYNSADIVFAVSKEDFDLLSSVNKIKNVFLISNIVKEYPRVTGARKPIVIFIGYYAWYPNPAAVKWFAAEIWPIIIEAVPEAEFHIIGSKPTAEVNALSRIPGIKVIGFVKETKPYLDMAAVSVAPLRIGGGMKGKVNEAMAHGIPVVATKIGAQGLQAVHGRHMMIADDPNAFAECVIKLLKDEKLQFEMGLSGQLLNSSICSQTVVKLKIEEVVQKCNSLIQEREGFKNKPGIFKSKNGKFRILKKLRNLYSNI
jgi:glycosyltransferase involved in cell wall biosynthesis